MATKELSVLVSVVPAPDAAVKTYGESERAFRVTGTSRATGKPVSDSKLSGIVTARLTSHEYRPQSTDADRNPREVTGPAVAITFAPDALGSALSADTAFTVNGRKVTSRMHTRLEWRSDAHRPLPAEYNRPRAAFFDEPGHWTLDSAPYSPHWTDAARPYALAVALQIAGYLATDETVSAYLVGSSDRECSSTLETLKLAEKIADAADTLRIASQELEDAYTVSNCVPLEHRKRARANYLAALDAYHRLPVLEVKR